jgi:tetratricopeptide (TPR) repeat protein
MERKLVTSAPQILPVESLVSSPVYPVINSASSSTQASMTPTSRDQTREVVGVSTGEKKEEKKVDQLAEVQQAFIDVFHGKFAEALRTFDRFLSSSSLVTANSQLGYKVRRFSGMIKLYKHEFKEAGQIFTSLLQEEKTNAENYFYRILTLLCQGGTENREAAAKAMSAVSAEAKSTSKFLLLATWLSSLQNGNYHSVIMHEALEKFFTSFFATNREQMNKGDPKPLVMQNDLYLVTSLLLLDKQEDKYAEEKYLSGLVAIKIDEKQRFAVCSPQHYRTIKHYQYYLQLALVSQERKEYAAAVDLALEGYKNYRLDVFEILVAKNLQFLLQGVMSGESKETFEQLAHLIYRSDVGELIKRCSVEEQYRVCNLLTEYLIAQNRHYNVWQLLSRIFNHANPALQALRYERTGDRYFFYGDCDAAYRHYKMAVEMDENPNRARSGFKAYITKIILGTDSKGVEDITKYVRDLKFLDNNVLDFTSEFVCHFLNSQVEFNFESFDTGIRGYTPDAKNFLLETQGIVLFYRKNFSASKQCFDVLIRAAPTSAAFPRFLIYRGRVLSALQRNKEASEIFGSIPDYRNPMNPLVKDIALAELSCLQSTSLDYKYYQRIRDIYTMDRVYDAASNLYMQIEAKYCQQVTRCFVNTLFFNFANKRTVNKEEKVWCEQVERLMLDDSSCKEMLLAEEVDSKDDAVIAADLKKNKDRIYLPARYDQTWRAQMSSCFKSSLQSQLEQKQKQSESKHTDIVDACQPLRLHFDNTPQGQIKNAKYSFFYDKFTDCLGKSFDLMRVLADGLAVKPVDEKLFELGEASASLISLLPKCDTIGVGVGLGLKLLKLSSRSIRAYNEQQAAERVVRYVVPGRSHVDYVCASLANAIFCMYQDQIVQLNTIGGIDKFVHYVCVLLLHYIQSDYGQNSSLMAKIKTTLSEFIRNAYRFLLGYVSSSLASYKEVTRTTTDILPGLFCCDLKEQAWRDSVRVVREDTKKDAEEPWYVDGILMRTGIRVPASNSSNAFRTFKHANSDTEKYGYRYASLELAQNLGFEETKEQAQLDSKPGCCIM